MFRKSIPIFIFCLSFNKGFNAPDCSQLLFDIKEPMTCVGKNPLFEYKQTVFYLLAKKTARFIMQLRPVNIGGLKNGMINTYLHLHKKVGKVDDGNFEAIIYRIEKHFVSFDKFLAAQDRIEPSKVIWDVLKSFASYKSVKQIGFVSFLPENIMYDVHHKKMFFIYAEAGAAEESEAKEQVETMTAQLLLLADILSTQASPQLMQNSKSSAVQTQPDEKKEKLKALISELKSNGFNLTNFFEQVIALESNSKLNSRIAQSEASRRSLGLDAEKFYHRISWPIIYGSVVLFIVVGSAIVVMVYKCVQTKNERQRNSDFTRRVIGKSVSAQ